MMDTGTRIHSPAAGLTEGGSTYGVYAEAYDPDNYWDPKKGPGPRVMAASTLEDDNVVNQAGEKLGEITEIMIDVPTGRVAYAVLSVGGFLGIGDKLLAIPWRALQIDPSNHRFVLNTSKERIKEAPGFDKDNWPSMADERWATELHNYYGAPYYWR
jgi:sporulation protein YlmC with PRC-barrel domain